MASHNFETLRRVVLNASRARSWSAAVEEWQVLGVEEDPAGRGICVCGKTGLVHLYTIGNRRTERRLFPIGSVCINLFEVEELSTDVKVLRRLFAMRAAFAGGKRVELTPEHFSRAVLADLWEHDAFPPNEYNKGNGENDYKFLLDIFNQRNQPSDAQSRKVWVLLNRTIRPFVLTDERLRT